MASKRRADKTEPPKPVEPVREVAVATPAPGRFDRLFARLKTLKGAVVAIAGVGAVLGGLAGYWNAYQAARSSTESAKLLALVGKGDAGPLSIVVLPFANLTGDPQQAYLADGLTAAVTSDLSRIRDAFIVSAATAFAYKDKPLTVQQIGRELGVRFALQGGVQRSGDKIRINAQLADTTTNAQLWSESFDGSQGDLFGLQEVVTARIGNSIGREMVIVAARESDRQIGEPKIADLLLRARALGLRPESKTVFEEEQRLLRQVLAVDPKNVQALTRLAASLSGEAYNGWVQDPIAKERQSIEARDLAVKVKELDPNNPSVYVVLSDFAIEHGDCASGVRLAQTALSLDPRSWGRYNNMATAHLDAGDPRSAIEVLIKGMRLNDKYDLEYLYSPMAIAHFMLGDYAAAIDWAKRTVDMNPKTGWGGPILAMAYAHQGDRTRAMQAAADYLRVVPDFNLQKFTPRKTELFCPAYREYWETKVLPAWRLAGLPE
jgi:adenylate cyclase